MTNEVAMTALEKHTVKKGKHNYTPGHGLGIRLRQHGFRLKAMIPSDVWYDPKPKGPLGSDGKDINKLGGISYFHPLKPWTWKPNKCAVMFGWRPSNQRGYFEIHAYSNDRKGGHVSQRLTTVKAGEKLLMTCGRWDRDKTMSFLMNGREAILPVCPRDFQFNVGPWFGGNRPAPHNHSIFTRLTHLAW